MLNIKASYIPGASTIIRIIFILLLFIYFPANNVNFNSIFCKNRNYVNIVLSSVVGDGIGCRNDI